MTFDLEISHVVWGLMTRVLPRKNYGIVGGCGLGKDCDHITEGSGSIFLVSLAELIGLYKSTRSALLHQDKELFFGSRMWLNQGPGG